MLGFLLRAAITALALWVASQLLDGLGAGRILRMDVVKDAQLVLNMPRRLGALDHA